MRGAVGVLELSLELLPVRQGDGPVRVGVAVHLDVLDEGHVVALGAGALVEEHAVELVRRYRGKLRHVVVCEEVNRVVRETPLRLKDHVELHQGVRHGVRRRDRVESAEQKQRPRNQEDDAQLAAGA